MNRRSLMFALALTLPAVPVLAQQQRPSTVLDLLSGTGAGATAFVERATIADNFGTESSRLLLEKSAHPQIRELASQTIIANAAMAAELRALPEASTRLPSGLDETSQRKLIELRAYQGDEMNRWYVQMQVESGTEIVQWFEAYAQNGEVPALKAFAVKHLPALRARLAQAQALQAPRQG